MDHLKDIAAFPFINPRQVSVREFIQSWSDILQEEMTLSNCKNHNERDASDLSIPLQMVKSLQKDLNPDKFCCSIEDEKLQAENLFKLASELELETLTKLHDHNEQSLDSSTYRMWHMPKYRHDGLNRPTSVAEIPDSRGPPLAVLTVQLFKPAIKTPTRARLSLDREFQVLSCQSLTVLRDSFICISDVLSGQDFSDNPEDSLPNFLNHDKLGFFFIDNTFYSDTRCENASFPKQIVQWAAERKIGQYTEKSMQQSKFEDLVIHIGFPYLYMHGNNCEHLLVFTDIQLLVGSGVGTTDLSPAVGYPRCTALESMQKVKCQMCCMCFSKWLVLNNQRLPESPFYFCHSCFKSFNYDDDGQKRGSFQAYPILFNL